MRLRNPARDVSTFLLSRILEHFCSRTFNLGCVCVFKEISLRPAREVNAFLLSRILEHLFKDFQPCFVGSCEKRHHVNVGLLLFCICLRFLLGGNDHETAITIFNNMVVIKKLTFFCPYVFIVLSYKKTLVFG